MRSDVGNMPPLPGVFPDYWAPIVRNRPDGRELVMARWGMPSPKSVLEGRKSDPGVTNIRNVSSAHWRDALGQMLDPIQGSTIRTRLTVPSAPFCSTIWPWLRP
jgi:hypothetical protein